MGSSCSVNSNRIDNGEEATPSSQGNPARIGFHSPKSKSISISTQTLLSFGSLDLTYEQIEGMKKTFGLELPITEIEQAPGIIVLPPNQNANQNKQLPAQRKESFQSIDSGSIKSEGDDSDSDNSPAFKKPKGYDEKETKKKGKSSKKRQESSDSESGEEEVEPLGEPEDENEQDEDNMFRRELSTKDSQLSAIVKTLTCRKKNDFGVPVFYQFEMIRTLGHGAFGKVKLAKNVNTGELFAVKQIKKKMFNKGDTTHRIQRFMSFQTLLKEQKQEEEEVQGRQGNGDYKSTTSEAISESSLIREIAILKKLNHDNIVKLFDVVEDESANSVFIVEEFCENGTLMEIGSGGKSKRPPFNEKQARKYILDLLKALRYLHSNGVIHLDIKPENLLITKNDVLKLSDFGVSHIFEGDNDYVSKTLGTPAFSAPETCELEPFRGKPADIWSAGIVLYAFVFGKLPFYSENPFVLARDIQTKPLSFPHPVSAELEDMMRRMLEKEPSKRINMEELFKHSFITENGTTSIVDENLITLSFASLTREELQNAVLPGTSAFRIETMKKFRAAVTMSKVVNQFKKNVEGKLKAQGAQAAEGQNNNNTEKAALNPKANPFKKTSLLDALKKAADAARQNKNSAEQQTSASSEMSMTPQVFETPMSIVTPFPTDDTLGNLATKEPDMIQTEDD